MFEIPLSVVVTFIILAIIGYSNERKAKSMPNVVVVPTPVLEGYEQIDSIWAEASA